jgi:hypothetical protein
MSHQSQSITMPIFAAAGNTHQHDDDDGDWNEDLDHGDHDMDFDLLAECLLEDNLGGPSAGISFDFGYVKCMHTSCL